MSSEYQNFLKMTQPLPTDSDWVIAQNNQLSMLSDSINRGDNKRKGGVNLS